MLAPLSRLPGDPVTMAGHNQGPPLDGAASWRRHCWKTAREALLPRLPLEIVRRRVKRARELGLEYPQYASILLGSGRDIVAFLFTSEALGLRLRRTLDMPAPTVDKLRALTRCDRLLLAGPDCAPEALAQALVLADAPRFRAVGAAPSPDAALPAGRAAIRAILDPLRLPGDAVVMIGARADERAWAEAARLARFVAAPAYFPAASP